MAAPPIRALEDALGHTFADPDLLQAALTHGSVEGRPSNQRLEFLGDRVLGLAVAASLFALYPKEAEGALTGRFHSLVRRETLDAVARTCGLGRLLRMSRAEEEQGGRTKPAILADAMEAVIAATFLDGGFPAAQAVVERLWAPYLKGTAEAPKAAKNQLQELAAARKLGQPAYEVLSQEGPSHAPVFTVVVTLGEAYRAEGEGLSKRAAEIQAAERLLAVLEGET